MKQKEKGQQLNKNAGFSLLELLIAVTILAIITIPMLHMFVTSASPGSPCGQPYLHRIL